MKKLRFFSISVIIILILTVLCSCDEATAGISIGTKMIDAEDYISIDYGKYNGYSAPVFDVDLVSMSTVFDTEKLGKFRETLPESVQFEFNYITSYAHFFNFDFAEDYNNVSNGDKLIINITLDSFLTDYGVTMDDFCKACGIKFTETTVEYTVSGLEELGNMLDLFENMEQYIYIEGANGYGTTDTWDNYTIPNDYSRQVGDVYFSKEGKNSLKIVINNKKVATVIYNVEPKSGLTAGDTISLTASVTPYGDTIVQDGIVFIGGYVCLDKNSKNVTVPDLGSYILSAEEMTTEIITEVRNQLIESNGVNSVEKVFLTTYQPGVENTRKLPCFFTVIVSDKRNLSMYEHFYMDTIESILVKKDGTIVIEHKEKDYPYYGSVENAIGEFNYGNYVYTEILIN